MNKKVVMAASAAAVFASGVALAGVNEAEMVNPVAKANVSAQYMACCAASSSCAACGSCASACQASCQPSCAGDTSDDTDD